MRNHVVLLLASTVVAVLTFGVGCSSADDTPGSLGERTSYGAEIPGPGREGDNGDDGEPGSGFVDGDRALAAADESVPGIQGTFAASTAKATADVNLRSGPGTSHAILAVIPEGSMVTVLDPTPQNEFLNIEFNGTKGWSHSGYLSTASPGGGGGGGGAVDVDGPPSPDNAVARAKASVGFSYWWGGGAWQEGGATSSNKGSCSGSCPSCSHSGQYGADCSGMVAKAWQFGTKALDDNDHPYSTSSFNDDEPGKWSTVSRGSLKAGDALVYNSGGAGHIVLYEKGDGWGSPTVYECKGCSYGCVHNTRSFGSSYHGIRRAGF
jgi:cell wall-associated NlpC family hydrolase